MSTVSHIYQVQSTISNKIAVLLLIMSTNTNCHMQ